jgi:hypothetical protein
LDWLERNLLLTSYVRRKRFEARLNALEIVNGLAVAMGGGEAVETSPTTGKKFVRVDTKTQLSLIGAGF